MPKHRWLASILLAMIAVGCAAPPLPTRPSADATPFIPSFVPTADPQTAAMDRRARAGLRADEAFVRLLLADPSSVARGLRLGIPLTEPELAQLEGQQQNALDIVPILNAYGADHRDEWGGLYIDDAAGGAIAVQFTGHLDDHTLAIANLLPPDAQWEVRQVRWSLRDLRALAERIKADQAFLKAAGAPYYGGGVDESENIAILRVQSADLSIGDKIIEHYDAVGRLRVEVFEPDWSGPRGDLVATIVWPDGRPVEDVDCELVPDEPKAWGEDIRGAGDDGVCRFNNVGATGILVQIIRVEPDGRRLIIGEGRVRVKVDRTVRLTIMVQR